LARSPIEDECDYPQSCGRRRKQRGSAAFRVALGSKRCQSALFLGQARDLQPHDDVLAWPMPAWVTTRWSGAPTCAFGSPRTTQRLPSRLLGNDGAHELNRKAVISGIGASVIFSRPPGDGARLSQAWLPKHRIKIHRASIMALLPRCSVGHRRPRSRSRLDAEAFAVGFRLGQS
jgi:hypothetical protein